MSTFPNSLPVVAESSGSEVEDKISKDNSSGSECPGDSSPSHVDSEIVASKCITDDGSESEGEKNEDAFHELPLRRSSSRRRNSLAGFLLASHSERRLSKMTSLLRRGSLIPKIGEEKNSSQEGLDEAPETIKEKAEECFITVETADGDIQNIKVAMQDDQFTVNPKISSTQALMAKALSEGAGVGFMPDIVNTGDQDQEKGARKSSGPVTFRSNVLSSLQDQKNMEKRMVSKGGKVNVNMRNVPSKRTAFIKDVFTTAIDMSWRYTILAFSCSFFISWTAFAVIWWLISYAHGDFETDNLPGGKNQESGEFTPCVWAMHNFASAYLFSVETQHTIGYGSRQTSEECPLAIIVMSIQSILGVLFSSCMAGVVFAKLARPKNRTHTLVFSKNAVISMQNGCLYLIFRVANLRKSFLIESHVTVNMVHAMKTTKEGNSYKYFQQELPVSTMIDDNNYDRTMLLLPCTVFHKVDKDSPFYGMTPKDIFSTKFELVVALEGIVEPTGNSVQARTSYLPREILWGYQFENMISYSARQGTYMVDVSYLNAVVQDKTPRKSQEQMDMETEESTSASAESESSFDDKRKKKLSFLNNICSTSDENISTESKENNLTNRFKVTTRSEPDPI